MIKLDSLAHLKQLAISAHIGGKLILDLHRA